ncbi:substrate-binding periplasmic protein [Pseudomonas zhanjiangensis]|uniref:Substrate-binding periplasmic protein n=1 Tax=Pseudomonas zhanjiangensis TaxID=3239015 RepID=A0ABV3YRC9_9PSED
MILALLASVGARAEPTLRVGTGDWPPYVDQGRDDGGALGRLISAVFAQAGYRVEYVFNPWKRNLLMLRKGELDAVMPYACSEARQAYSLCSAPLVYGDVVLFRSKGADFDWQRIEDLAAYRIGTTLGYSYGPQFDEKRGQGLFNIQESAKSETALRLLLHGRIDIHPQDRAVGYALLQRQFSAAERALIDHHPRSLNRESLHLLFRSGDAQAAELHRRFNQGLQALARNGELQRLQKALYEGKVDAWAPRSEP